MCFSATASFGAGIVLSTIGIATLKKASSPSHTLFAGIPLLFAVQQISEGILWLALPDPSQVQLQRVMTYAFLFFAQILWPTWVPLAILLPEKNPKRRKILKVITSGGVITSVYLGYCLLTYPVQAEIIGMHVSYLQDYPEGFFKMCIAALYGIATITPALFSSIKKMWILGVAVLISYIITAIFYEDYIISVWCFFASIISITVYVIMLEARKAEKDPVA